VSDKERIAQAKEQQKRQAILLNPPLPLEEHAKRVALALKYHEEWNWSKKDSYKTAGTSKKALDSALVLCCRTIVLNFAYRRRPNLHNAVGCFAQSAYHNEELTMMYDRGFYTFYKSSQGRGIAILIGDRYYTTQRHYIKHGCPRQSIFYTRGRFNQPMCCIASCLTSIARQSTMLQKVIGQPLCLHVTQLEAERAEPTPPK
jgi:hypothetical protein